MVRLHSAALGIAWKPASSAFAQQLGAVSKTGSCASWCAQPALHQALDSNERLWKCRRNRLLAAMANIYRPEFEEGERPEGFRSRRARIGYELGSELIGASLWEVPPGEAAYPYHFHYADEELVIVLLDNPACEPPMASAS
jgi:hypothetical protein